MDAPPPSFIQSSSEIAKYDDYFIFTEWDRLQEEKREAEQRRIAIQLWNPHLSRQQWFTKYVEPPEPFPPKQRHYHVDTGGPCEPKRRRHQKRSEETARPAKPHDGKDWELVLNSSRDTELSSQITNALETIGVCGDNSFQIQRHKYNPTEHRLKCNLCDNSAPICGDPNEVESKMLQRRDILISKAPDGRQVLSLDISKFSCQSLTKF